MARGVLFDSTLCVGCRECEGACAKRWNQPYDESIARTEKISYRKLTTIQTKGENFVRRMCMHCVDPACASVCPVGALEKTKLGPVVYHEDRCMGCRYCMVACPFNVPSYTWNEPLPKVKKCDMCFERQSAGKQTACAEACPTGATLLGERDELIAEAKKRLAEKPAEYHPKVYGIEEVGGTSVLFLSKVPFEQLGLRTDLPRHALPQNTWAVLSHVPDVAAVGSVLLGGVYWITHRREAVARAEAKGGAR
ncbi:MAG: 4Fe-4S dicluster domain-containing protein [Bryobacteraceae bacterium]|nr:4Fe-4S dicluster domain-containing protein [Bryobacteraceae bacterium]